MYQELYVKYDNPDYPVKVDFVESGSEKITSEWMVRPQDTEIIILNYGSFIVEAENSRHQVMAGQGVLINSATPYRIIVKESEEVSYYRLLFSTEFILPQAFSSSLAEKYYMPLSEQYKLRCFVLDEANLRDESVLDKINTIIAINHTKKLGYEMTTKGLICLLWVAFLEIAVLEHGEYNSKNLPSQDELRVKSATEYIREYYQDQITLEDIADKIHVSRNECCRCFKRVLGISPVDYLIKLRVYHAARFIYKNPTGFDTISDLAFSVGFNSASYFNKMFKRYFQCTPTEFKTLLKTNPREVTDLYDSLEDTIKNM